VRLFRAALLAMVDTVSLGLVCATAIWIWAIGVRGQPFSLYLPLTPLLVLFILGYVKAGLYPGFGIGAVETLRRFTLWTTYLFAVLAASSFVFKTPPLYSRGTFFLSWLGSLVVVPLARFLVLSFISRREWWGEPAVVLDTGPLARRAIRSMRHALTLGYRPRCVLRLGESAATSVEGIPVVGGLEQSERIADLGICVAVLAGENVQQRSRTIEFLQRHFRHVIVVPRGDQTPIEGVAMRNLGGVLGIEFRNQLLRRRNRVIKRTLDISLGLLLGVATLPLVALGALAVLLVDGRPVFFSQRRIGLDGRQIAIRKLRTMFIDAEERLEEHLSTDEDAKSEWENRFKLAADPRLLPVIGSLFRRLSIDELPQLWQVVQGRLSLVGPRPFPEYHLRKFTSEFRELRQRVRPGITGLWQVMVRNDGGLEEQEVYDGYYIRNWSVWMDVYVLARTLLAVLSARGAY
jgi:Undecaprenyl-phosphate galactose phosphotransferase WbaP